MGARLQDAGFDVLANPFGTLYNPASLAAAVERLDSARPFTREECVEMGAGAGRVCSFSHHTSFARPTAEEFLAYANARLIEDAARWRTCKWVLLTLGTAWVWRALERPGQPVVAHCLKRPAREFAHELLSVEACTELLRGIVEGHPDKQFILTVSPIRHLGAGAHANTLSKSTLHLAVENLDAAYFPAYEILMDELRDYRFYREDMLHPSAQAVEYIWQQLVDHYFSPAAKQFLQEWAPLKAALNHRPFNPDSDEYRKFLADTKAKAEALREKTLATLRHSYPQQ